MLRGENLNYKSKGHFAQTGFMNALQNNGLDFILKNFITIPNMTFKSEEVSSELIEAQYYNSWKLGLWRDDAEEIFDSSTSTYEKLSFNKHFYGSLNLFINSESCAEKCSSLLSAMIVSIQTCKKILFEELKTNSIEVVNILNSIIGRFYNLNQLHKVVLISDTPSILNKAISLNQHYLLDYELKFFAPNESYNFFSDLFSVRCIIAKTLLKSNPICSNEIKNSLLIMHDACTDHAVLHKRFQVSGFQFNWELNYFFLKKIPIHLNISHFRVLKILL